VNLQSFYVIEPIMDHDMRERIKFVMTLWVRSTTDCHSGYTNQFKLECVDDLHNNGIDMSFRIEGIHLWPTNRTVDR